MDDIPDDITPILREIDDSLKANGIPPHARSVHAIRAFGMRYQIKMPLFSLPPNAPADMVRGGGYAMQIHSWYEVVYGNRMKIDPSANAKMAVIADGDVWELRLPLFWGSVGITVSRQFLPEKAINISRGPSVINACQALTDITEARLAYFSDVDLTEVGRQYSIGLEVREAFERFRPAHQKFIEAESDWATAVMLLTSQHPNFGQSRWASLQMCEKFMKGLVEIIGDTPQQWGHDLTSLHKALAVSIPAVALTHLFPDIQCSAKVRYGEEPSTREQAYTAHKSALLLVKALGSVKNGNS